MYSASDVARFIINWCNNSRITITNLKLQKLLYFVQGEYSKITGNRLIADDFQAWQLGPVIPSVYSSYAMYSSSPIWIQNIYNKINSHDEDIISSILLKYAKLSTWTLVDLSHTQDPWKYNYEMFGDKAVIPYPSIAQYYKRIKA